MAAQAPHNLFQPNET